MGGVIPLTERSDEELLSEVAREGSDGPAFVELMNRHRDRIWRLCYRLMGNSEDASDAAQEVFVRLFLNRTKFAGRSALSTWISGIAVRTCLTMRRGRSRRLRREAALGDGPLEATTPDSTEATSRQLDLHQMLDTLSEDDRAMLLLKHTEGYSYEELATLFEMSVSACKMRVSRACDRIQAQYQTKNE